MCSILAQFRSDNHWETFFARALSQHLDREFEAAAEHYEESVSIIERDPNTAGVPLWEATKAELGRMRERALNHEDTLAKPL
jgi:hypothetical protein